jgi:putative zinc finger protein
MEHDRSPLAAYALHALDPDEAREVDAHVAGCDECRAELAELTALEAALGEVPPEAFLDGPPEGGDLMLQRTLRQVRAERAQVVARTSRPRRWLAAAAVVALVGAALAGGALVGRGTAPSPQAAPSTVVTTPAGTRTVAGTDTGTGTKLTGVVIPAAGWVRVHVKVEGVPAGTPCRLEVVPRSGAPILAGSWLVSANGEKQGTTLDGTALVSPSDVAAVDVVTADGRKLVSVPV